jgi:lipoate-protein ligase A
MAADQAILQLIDRTRRSTLRIYCWAPATLSLGYFQSICDRLRHMPSQMCPVVRRVSGGGAILHDHEITYSLSFSSDSRWSADNTQVYTLVHDEIVAAFQEWGVLLERFGKKTNPVCGQTGSSRMQDRESCLVAKDGVPAIQLATYHSASFLCFQRRADGDLMFGENKIVGSAQRRNRNAVLQHGSILLQSSKYAPELPGIEELCGRRIDQREFTGVLIERLSRQLGLKPVPADLDDAEFALTSRLIAEQFGNDCWTRKR